MSKKSSGKRARQAGSTYKAQMDRYERLAALSPEAAADIRARLWSIHVDYGTHLYDLHTVVYSQLPGEAGDGSDREPLERPQPLSADILADLAETVRAREHAAWTAQHG